MVFAVLFVGMTVAAGLVYAGFARFAAFAAPLSIGANITETRPHPTSEYLYSQNAPVPVDNNLRTIGDFAFVEGSAVMNQSVVLSDIAQSNLSPSQLELLIPVDGLNWGKVHKNNAVDIAAPCGTPVRAADDGIVIIDPLRGSGLEGWNGGHGLFVLIQHRDGTETRYSHLSRIFVNPGQLAKRGEIIAEVGNTGETHGPTGCHLHFEVLGTQNPFAI